MAASELYARANEAFVDDNYDQALALYDQAIELEPDNAGYLVKRAACHMKLQDYASAVADTAMVLKMEPSNVGALSKKGIACYHMKEYATALSAFKRVVALEPKNATAHVWLRKCELALPSSAEPAAAAPTPRAPPAVPAPAAPAPASAPAPVPAGAPTAPVANARIRHEWYQTPTDVYVSILIKKARAENVTIDIQRQSLSVDVALPEAGVGRSFNLELDLAGLVVPDKSSWQVFATKIEIRLHKESSVKWDTLEWTGEQAAAPMATGHSSSGGGGGGVVPTGEATAAHKKRAPQDWDRLVCEIKEQEEEEEKGLDGEAGLQKLLRQIYSAADEDTRRAMNKSYSESGGTVLSTNWQEIGAQKTEVKPPEGMEAKTYLE